MKKYLLLFALILATASSLYSEVIPLNTHRTTTNSSEAATRVERMPMRIDIEVFYNSDSRTIDVTGSENYDAEVFIYDASGKVESYSPFLNCTLPVVTAGTHRILIKSENWYAEGSFIE